MSSVFASIRGLRANPGFALVAVLTMALAIGANAAIFSAYDQLVLHPVSVPDPDSLVAIWFNNPKRNVQTWSSSVPRFDELQEDTTVFSSYGLSAFDNMTLTGRGDPLPLNVLRVNASFLPTLGVLPARGRNFTAAEDVRNGPAVCILTAEFWQSQLGGESDIVGQVIQLDGAPWQVVGIMPPRLSAPFGPIQVIVPRVFDSFGLTAAQIAAGGTFAQPIARLRPGVSLEQTRQRLAAFSLGYQQRHPTSVDANNVSEPHSFVSSLVGGVQPTMVTLLGAVACVLLIACANIASLFLSRLLNRSKEIAIRLSLGATRLGIVQHFLAESAALSIGAAAVGIGLAFAGLAALQTSVTAQLPQNTALSLSWRALTFTAAITIVSTMLTGLYPALQASRPAMVDQLKDGVRGSSSAGGGRVRQGLIVSEVTLCVILLVGAGLLLTTFLKLENAPLGFDPGGVASATVSLTGNRYSTPGQQLNFFARVLENLRAQPGVVAAAVAANVPLGCCFRTTYGIAGAPLPPLGQRPVVNFNVVSEDYFTVLRIPIAAGRRFTADDRNGGPGVGIVNDTFAKHLFPGRSAVGESLVISSGSKQLEIVGVIPDAKDNGAAAVTPEELYVPLTQFVKSASVVAVRTTGEAATLEGSIRRAVAAADPMVAASSFATLDGAVTRSLGTQRLAAILISLFAGVALLLALSGLYAVLAHVVSQRTLEIGIRMALGATRRDVVWLTMAQGLLLVGVGVLLGLGTAGLVARVIRQQLFGIEPLNPLLYVLVAGAFSAVAALACLVPSLRASRIDPLVAVRARCPNTRSRQT